MKPSPHGCYGCYNRNYLMAAALSSSGILVDNKLKIEMTDKLLMLRLLSGIYMVYKYAKFKYYEYSKKLGTIESLSSMYNSKEYKFIQLLAGNYSPGNVMRALIIACKDDSQYRFSYDILKSLVSQEAADKFYKIITDWGCENPLDLVRKRSLYKQVSEIFANELNFKMLKDFNEKNIKTYNLLVSKYNLMILRNNFGYQGDDWKAGYESLIDMQKDLVKDKLLLIPDDLETRYRFTSVITDSKILTKEQKDKFIKYFSDFSDYVLLYNYYKEWKKFSDVEKYSVLDTISKDAEITVDNKVMKLKDLESYVEAANLNSPLIKNAYLGDPANSYFKELIEKYLKFRWFTFHNYDKNYENSEGYKVFLEQLPELEKEKDLNTFVTTNMQRLDQNIFPHEHAINALTMSIDHKLEDNICIADEPDITMEMEYIKYYSCYALYNVVHKQLTGYILGQLDKDLHEINSARDDFTYVTGPSGKGFENYRIYKPWWNVMGVTTKRWSTGIHTWKPGTDSFRMLISEQDCVAIYFDISQAEVRFIAYISKDPDMMDMYNKGVDIYVKMASVTYPNRDASYHKQMRSAFKSIVLGLLYGRGAKSIAEQIEVDIKEVMRMIATFRKMFPVLNEFIQRKKDFCAEHGYIETFLGDKLFAEKERASTVGINYFVQNGASVILEEGFYNLYENLYKDREFISPKIVVHDSHTLTCYIKNIFSLIPKIDIHFKKYLYEKYGVLLKYDFVTFTNFRDKIAMSYDKENHSLDMEGNELGLTDWFSRFDKYFTYDKEVLSEKINGYNIIHGMFHGKGLKQFTHYSDNNFIVPNKYHYKITNIKPIQ